MANVENLRVFQQAHALVLDVYAVTKPFPSEERFGLTAQARRSAASIPTNLAEGSAVPTDAGYRRFVGVALGSAAELAYQLRLAASLGYLDDATANALRGRVDEISRMLRQLHRTLSS